jgi:hypothetical protein
LPLVKGLCKFPILQRANIRESPPILQHS